VAAAVATASVVRRRGIIVSSWLTVIVQVTLFRRKAYCPVANQCIIETFKQGFGWNRFDCEQQSKHQQQLQFSKTSNAKKKKKRIEKKASRFRENFIVASLDCFDSGKDACVIFQA
jgi:hypothetical protein